MIRFDLILEKSPSITELQQALANAFSIEYQAVLITTDYDSYPTEIDCSKIWCISTKLDGKFTHRCDVVIRDKALETSADIIAPKVCKTLDSKCLISDDSPKPFSWLQW